MPGRKNVAGMGSIRQRSDGRYEGRYTGTDGKQHSVYGKTEEECAKQLRSVLVQVDTGKWLKPDDMTVDAWLDIWQRDWLGYASHRTKITYDSIIRTWLKPIFNGIKLQALSPVHIKQLQTKMEQAGKSVSSINTAYAVLGASLTCAVNEAKLLNANPMANIKHKRTITRSRDASKRMTIIDRPLMPKFVEVAYTTDYPELLLIMLQTGLRTCEVCGLKWDDIEWDVPQINIQRQLFERNVGQAVILPPKDNSYRSIVITPETVSLLKEVRRKQIENKLAAGSEWIETDMDKGLVFRQPNGSRLRHGNVYRLVLSIAKPLGIPNLHPHALRDSYAVAALRSGIDVKTVQNNLGHKSATMTLDCYAQYTDDAGKVGAELLSDYWNNAVKKKNGLK